MQGRFRVATPASASSRAASRPRRDSLEDQSSGRRGQGNAEALGVKREPAGDDQEYEAARRRSYDDGERYGVQYAERDRLGEHRDRIDSRGVVPKMPALTPASATPASGRSLTQATAATRKHSGSFSEEQAPRSSGTQPVDALHKNAESRTAVQNAATSSTSIRAEPRSSTRLEIVPATEEPVQSSTSLQNAHEQSGSDARHAVISASSADFKRRPSLGETFDSALRPAVPSSSFDNSRSAPNSSVPSSDSGKSVSIPKISKSSSAAKVKLEPGVRPPSDFRSSDSQKPQVKLLLAPGILDRPLGMLYLKIREMIVIANSYRHKVHFFNIATQKFELVVGTGKPGLVDGPANVACFRCPATLIANSSETVVYLCDLENHCIRAIKIDTGEVTTVAGNGTEGFEDSENPEDAVFTQPEGICWIDETVEEDSYRRESNAIVTHKGIILVADTYNHCIRKIDTHDGVVTVCGKPETRGFKDGTGSNARFHRPHELVSWTDSFGHKLVFVADFMNHAIRRIDEDWCVSTITFPSSKLYLDIVEPMSLDIDQYGRILLVDKSAYLISMIIPGSKVSAGKRGSLHCHSRAFYYDLPEEFGGDQFVRACWKNLEVTGTGEMFVISKTDDSVFLMTSKFKEMDSLESISKTLSDIQLSFKNSTAKTSKPVPIRKRKASDTANAFLEPLKDRKLSQSAPSFEEVDVVTSTCDFMILIKENDMIHHIPVHKSVLDMYYPLSVIIGNSISQNSREWCFEGTSTAAVEVFLEWMYTGKLPSFSLELGPALFDLANVYCPEFGEAVRKT